MTSSGTAVVLTTFPSKWEKLHIRLFSQQIVVYSSQNKLTLTITKEVRNRHSNWKTVLFLPPLKTLRDLSIIDLLRPPKGSLIALPLIKWVMSMVYERRVVGIDKAARTSNLGLKIYFRQALTMTSWYTNLLYRRHKAVINCCRNSKKGSRATRAWTDKLQLCKYLKRRVPYYRISQTKTMEEIRPTLKVQWTLHWEQVCQSPPKVGTSILVQLFKRCQAVYLRKVSQRAPQLHLSAIIFKVVSLH